jgi:hypothetical protein
VIGVTNNVSYLLLSSSRVFYGLVLKVVITCG